MNKRGQGISMEFIIIAAIALIVLIVIILFFTGGIQKLTGSQQEVIAGTIPDWKRQAWENTCKLACTAGNTKEFCSTLRKYDSDGDGKSDSFFTCSKDIRNINPAEAQGLTDGGGLGIECDIDCKKA